MADNATMVRSLFEAWNKRDYNTISQQMAPNSTLIDMGSGRTLQGSEGAVQFTKSLFDALPDGEFTIDHLTAKEDTVVVEYTGRGTHTGDLVIPAGTVPATGRPLTMHLCDIYEIRDGKVQTVRTYIDSGAIMAQLGLAQRLGVTP